MSIRKLISCLLIAASAAIVTAPSQARTGIYLDIAPPAPRVEVVPEARPGWVWAPGYWGWNGHRHVWVHGHWLRERHGWRWTPDAWVDDGGRHHLVRGHWER